MLKRKILSAVTMGFGLLLFAGCAGDESEALEAIDEAFEMNENLDNGRFETVLTIQAEGEVHEQKTEGSFVRQGEEDFDWYTLTYPNVNIEDNYVERVRVDESLYEKVTVQEQTDLPWEEVVEEIPEFPAEAGPLFEGQDLEEADTVEVEEADGLTTYTVTLNDAFGEELVEENVATLEESIEEMEDNELPEEFIETTENRIEQVEATTYSDFVYTYLVDDAGYVVRVENDFLVTNPDESSYTSANTYELLDYNLEDVDGLIPTVE